MLAAEAAIAARRRWKDLPPHDQDRLREIVPKAKAGPSGLSAKDKADLKRILRSLDVPGIGKELLPVVGKRYKKRHARLRGR